MDLSWALANKGQVHTMVGNRSSGVVGTWTSRWGPWKMRLRDQSQPALRGPDVKWRCGLYLGRVLVSVPKATAHGG